MYSVRVCSTNDRELPPPELGPGLTWDRLTEILSREVSPDAAGLFAEPIHDEMRLLTHWHITSRDDPKPVSALSTAEQESLFQELSHLSWDILQFAARREAEGGDPNMRLAAALRTILSVPDERRHVWSADGKPVLSAWGRAPDVITSCEGPGRVIERRSIAAGAGAVELGATITGTSSKPFGEDAAAAGAAGASGAASSADGPGASAAFAEQIGQTAAAPIAQRRPVWPAALLWTLFALLIATAYYELLPACGLDLPVLSRLSDHCAYAGQNSLLSEQFRNASLRAAIVSAELEVAKHRGLCATQNFSEAETPSNSPPSMKDAELRSQEVHAASSGKLDITLVWNGREDLDLNVYCPGGHIFYGNREACGGLLDIDRNSKRSEAVLDPIEHTGWQNDPPSGTYRVEVVLFDRFEEPARDIPFNLVIRDPSGEREFKGKVQLMKTPVLVTSFQR